MPILIDTNFKKRIKFGASRPLKDFYCCVLTLACKVSLIFFFFRSEKHKDSYVFTLILSLFVL